MFFGIYIYIWYGLLIIYYLWLYSIYSIYYLYLVLIWYLLFLGLSRIAMQCTQWILEMVNPPQQF